MKEQEYLYQWEHETGVILGEKHEVRELEDAFNQINDYIDLGFIKEVFEWDLVSFDSNSLIHGFVVAI